MTFKPLHSTPSLSERAYQAIKDAILSLKIRPGEILSINSLADQLEVSRTPVRDALLRLEGDGLVIMVPHKGIYVTEILAKDIEDLYELRILLESYAAKVAATKLTTEELERIEVILRETQNAFEQQERVLASDLGRQLHDILVNKVNNDRLTNFLSDLDIHYTRIRRFSTLIPGRFEKSHKQHREIFAALMKPDPLKAEQAMQDHLISVQKDILANIDVWMNYLENEEITFPILELPLQFTQNDHGETPN